MTRSWGAALLLHHWALGFVLKTECWKSFLGAVKENGQDVIWEHVAITSNELYGIIWSPSGRMAPLPSPCAT